MRLLIASDIHGSATYCDRLLSRYEAEGADRLVLLGDILYHGPRNGLPDGYDPKKVADRLNAYAERILCVRGNCDSEVDQMVLAFPVLSDYATVLTDKACLYLTHGHVYNIEAPLPVPKGSVVLSGHTHVPACREQNGVYYLNPGSVSLPKGGSARGYILYMDGTFLFKSLDGEVLHTFSSEKPAQ
ncbi:MAG: phosphodiesterase [Clostridia bacterium]|nr:phosphodiesterase [Clostridia bacterium]